MIQATHKEKARQEKLRLGQTATSNEREAVSDYVSDNTLFKLPLGKLKAEGGDMQQFNQFYFRRLEQLRPAVKEAAELKWDTNAEFVDNILDLRPYSLTVIIGTIFKEQKAKPCVFTDITNVIKSTDFAVADMSFGPSGVYDNLDLAGKYVQPGDQCILEDCSGRINIKEGEHFDSNNFVTGTIVALLGRSDNQGYFGVMDSCVAGIPFKP